MNICHKSSLVRDILSVNWTLFRAFDRNNEFAIEFEYSLLCDAYCVRRSVMRRRRTVPLENGLEGLYLERKDPTNENDFRTSAAELEGEAVFGRMARTAHCRSTVGSTERKLS